MTRRVIDGSFRQSPVATAPRGSDELERLVELLGGSESVGPDLPLIDEVVHRTTDAGLQVSPRPRGGPARVSVSATELAFRSSRPSRPTEIGDLDSTARVRPS